MTRIDGLNPLATGRTMQGQGAQGVDGRGNSSRNTDGAERAAGQDNVTLSSRSKVMGLANRAVQDAPEVRAERVAQLKAQIANGTYTSDAQAIAARLISTGTFGE